MRFKKKTHKQEFFLYFAHPLQEIRFKHRYLENHHASQA